MYRFMSEEEIEIRQICDLKMIHFYRLGGNDALAVHYGDNKQINLCSMDANYNLLIERVLSLYSQCEDKNSIVIEASSQKLLDKAMEGALHNTSFFQNIGKKYVDMETSANPLFASDGVLRETLLPLLKYYLKQLFHMWNVKAEFMKENPGWHRRCVLKVRTMEETKILPVRINETNDNSYTVTVGNFMQDLNNITFEIDYLEDRIHIIFESEDFSLFGESHYLIDSQKVTAHTSIQVSGQVVYHQEEPVEICTNISSREAFFSNKYKKMTGKKDMDGALFRLPWGGMVLYKATETTETGYKRTDYRTVYMEEHLSKMVLRHYSYSLVENIADGLKLRTDGAVMRTLYFGDKSGQIETHFFPAGCYSGWDYKEYLESKYFYHKWEETNNGVI